MRALLLALALIAPAASTLGQPPASNLIHAEVNGLRNSKGQVVFSLFASAEGFLKDDQKAVARTKSSIAGGHAVCEFPAVAPGRYAIEAFHDENSNNKLDTNFIGMPREGVGTSNNPKGHFGPPRFDDAAFSYSGGRQQLTIKITYL